MYGTASLAVGLIAPVFYAVAFVLMLDIVLRSLILGPFGWLPETGVVVLPALLFGAVFAFYAWALLRLERLHQPTLVDHLRRCAFLYAGLAMMVALFITQGEELETGVSS